MPNITIDIPLNGREHGKLQKWLAQYNKQRRRLDLPTFPSYNAAMIDFVYRKVKASARSADKNDAKSVHRKFIDADEGKQNAVKNILGV